MPKLSPIRAADSGVLIPALAVDPPEPAGATGTAVLSDVRALAEKGTPSFAVRRCSTRVAKSEEAR